MLLRSGRGTSYRWATAAPKASPPPNHPKFLLLSLSVCAVRADVTHGSTILANRSTPAERAASKADTHWTDTFERFHPDCREILETPSKWGIDRNVGFDADVVVPSVDRDVQVDGRGEVVTALPMPMPECVRGIGWAEQVWADASSRADTANSSKL